MSGTIDRTAAPQTVEIVGVDYAFKSPSSLRSGTTRFTFRNAGKKNHELNIFLLKRGATIDDVIKAQARGKSQLDYIDGAVGVIFAGPGKTSKTALTANLLPGRDYGVICIFRDAPKDPRHLEMGMYGVLHVTEPSAGKVVITADSIIGTDYSFARYPKEISAGRHFLAFRNAGKQRHEIGISLLKEGVTLDSLAAVEKRDGDVEKLLERGGRGVLHARGGESSLGMLEIDFLPGRDYAIECGFADDPKSPPHYTLGMFGVIHVKGTEKKL